MVKVKQLPEEWRERAEALIKKHSVRWRDIRIGLPDRSNSPIPSVFAYATPQSGERVYWIVTQDNAGFHALDKFLSSS